MKYYARVKQVLQPGIHKVLSEDQDRGAVLEEMPHPDLLEIELNNGDEAEPCMMYRYTESGEFCGDTWHENLQKAMKQAEFEYGTKASDWATEMHEPFTLRVNWRGNWLRNIYEFANCDLQRRSWIEGPSGKWPEGQMWVSSYVECRCGYFDDLALDDGYEMRVQEGLLSEEEANQASSFHRLVANYEAPSGNHEDIIVDASWQEVTAEARRLWHILKSITKDPKDMCLMNDLESTYGTIKQEQT